MAFSMAFVGSVLTKSIEATQGNFANKFAARAATAPRQIVYGECRVGGTIAHMETAGTDNHMLHMIVVLAGAFLYLTLWRYTLMGAGPGLVTFATGLFVVLGLSWPYLGPKRNAPVLREKVDFLGLVEEPAKPNNVPVNLLSFGILLCAMTSWGPQIPDEFFVLRLVLFLGGLALIVVGALRALTRAAEHNDVAEVIHQVLTFLAPWFWKGVWLFFRLIFLGLATCNTGSMKLFGP